MPLPYRIATLLYAFHEDGRVLLIERNHQPNRGCFSPPGGKLHTDAGESPHTCAIREFREETGLELSLDELHLTGIISEHGYQGNAHWLMFLFEVSLRLTELPPDHEEGPFRFATKEELGALPLPDTDREQIWPLFWKHRGGFFAAYCHCTKGAPDEWTLEQSNPIT
ncbi:MAG: NUDIX domain-containing protein [Verrucomicrobiota bacterium]|jgi:8-oxo-dGTP diphosphatase|nr:NUDIX domain-containing protein [Verrucomicrobiota bacterium]